MQVLQLDDRHSGTVNKIWKWLHEEWSGKSIGAKLRNALDAADPLHLIATFIMALPAATADAAATPPAAPLVGIEPNPGPASRCPVSQCGSVFLSHEEFVDHLLTIHPTHRATRRLMQLEPVEQHPSGHAGRAAVLAAHDQAVSAASGAGAGAGAQSLKLPAKRSVDHSTGSATKRSKHDADPHLTLQPSHPSWCRPSLRCSAVHQLAVTPLEQLQAKFREEGVAHIEHVVSADLIERIADEVIPMLTTLLAKTNAPSATKTGAAVHTGVTVEIIDGEVWERETGEQLFVPQLKGLLQRLLADRRLQETARQVLGPRAAVRAARLSAHS